MSRFDKAVIIIGEISAGKSTIAKLIASKYKIPIASFGGFLKAYSSRNNLVVDRRHLQDLGEHLIKCNPEEFLLNVIDFSCPNSKTIIFEGVRHFVIFELIQKYFCNTLSIFIDTPYEVRKERYLLREKDIDTIKGQDQFELANSHPTESEIIVLKYKCDFIVDSLEKSEIITVLERFLAR